MEGREGRCGHSVYIFRQRLVPAGLDTWWQDTVTTHESSMGYEYGESLAFGSVRRMLVYVLRTHVDRRELSI